MPLIILIISFYNLKYLYIQIIISHYLFNYNFTTNKIVKHLVYGIMQYNNVLTGNNIFIL